MDEEKLTKMQARLEAAERAIQQLQDQLRTIREMIEDRAQH